ncbi:MAG: TRAP transporter substrate-binding protein [Desulfobacterales bacterium]|nr:TRAP transporter substrate-binding protein [Desulfobacterales bacterium]
MENKFFRNLSSFTFLVVLILGISGVAISKPIQLTYANFFPPFHIQSKLAESWCKEVESRTQGKVKINYYPGGTLTKAPQTYDSVEQGIADIGMSVLAYSRGRFPVLGTVDLPMGYPDGVTATKAANGVLNQFNPKEFKDTQIMYLHAHGPGLIHTREKEVRTLADLVGLKIRATGMSAKFVKALGATPVGMGMPDAYQSLQKGVVDGCAHPLEANKGWKLADVLKFAVDENSVAYSTTFFVTMNKAKWAALPADIQKTIIEINTEWAVKHGEAWDSIDAEGRELFLEKGNKILTLAPEESAKWQAAVRPAIDAYAADLSKKGINGEEIVDYILSILNP